ncbi:hypothetical protein BC829DRAFT_54257 [Chytridium lagenaria]|nr:hypothetical protein BC829DRAFT_54257 [Chytridium lagenaria]
MMTLADIQAAGGSQKLPDYKSQDTWAKSRIENFELSSIVSSHAKYKEALQDILDFVGFERLPQTEEQRSAPTLGSRTGSLQSLTDVNPEEKRKQILQFMPRKSSLAHAAPSPSTSQTPTPTLSSSMDKPRQRMSSRTFDRQDFRDKILLESTSNVSAKPPPIHVHVPPPTPVSVDTLFDSDIESGEKLDGDLGTDIGNVDIIDIYGSGFSSDTGKIMDVRGQNLMTPHMHGRRSSPIEAVFEPNALAIDPLSRGTSSVSLGEDEMDRREGNSWVGTDIDDRVYRGPVAEVVGTPYSAKPR